jgi:hypothetical protein
MGIFSSIRRVVANTVLLPISLVEDLAAVPIQAIKGQPISIPTNTIGTVKELGSALVDTEKNLREAAAKDL